MKYILGIDPGLSGALALYNPETKDVEIVDMPTHEIKVNGKKKRTLDIYALGRWIDLNMNLIKEAIIEEPSAAPGQGVTSMFNFGFSCGVAQAVVAANMIPMTLVRPATWKKALGLTSEKDLSRRRASMLFPQHIGKWTRAKDDGRAEALLLAYYRSKTQ